MSKWNTAALLFLAVAFPISPLIIAESAKDTITKQNQADQDCGLTVSVDDRGNGLRLTVSIPKDDKRLERLISTRFVLGTNGSPWPWKILVPIKVSETVDGSKRFEVRIQRSQLHDSFLEFTSNWPDPTRSSVDVCHLNLESYIDSKGND
jgi:hypothetical protein